MILVVAASPQHSAVRLCLTVKLFLFFRGLRLQQLLIEVDPLSYADR